MVIGCVKAFLSPVKTTVYTTLALRQATLFDDRKLSIYARSYSNFLHKILTQTKNRQFPLNRLFSNILWMEQHQPPPIQGDIDLGSILREQVFKLTKIGYWSLDIETKKVFWSDELYAIHGIPLGTEILLKDGIDFYREDFRSLISDAVDKAIRNNEPYDIECVLVTKQGEEKWVRTLGEVVMSEGKVVRVCGVLQDIHERKLKDFELQESEFRYRSVLDHTFNFVGLLDPNGILLEANQAALRFGGFTFEDVKGKHFADAPWWSKSPEINKQVREALALAAKGEFIRYDVEVVGAEQNQIIDFSISPIYDEGGSVKFLVPDARDITDRVATEKKLKESLEQLHRFVNFAPAAVAMFDNNMCYLAASSKWIEDYQIPTKDIIGKSHYEIFPEILNMPEWLQIHQDVLAGNKYETPKDKFIREDGRVQWLKYTLLPWYKAENEVGGIIMYTADITSEIVYQEELAKLNLTLKTRVQEQTNTVQLLNKEMEQFVYIASHDLQEPLRTISNFTGLLDQQERSDQERFLIQRISAATKRMQTLVKDLLDYSRTGRNIKREELDLNLLIENIVHDLDQVITDTGAQIQIEKLPTIHAAESDIRQLFQNLIGNAIKYQGLDSVPAISVKAEAKNEGWVFSVADNGIGIKSSHQERVFQIFQRLHTSEEFEGTGIGLAMCKKIVEQYNGQIWVDSTPGEGSTFSFTLGTANFS